jgi:hypothetical protein
VRVETRRASSHEASKARRGARFCATLGAMSRSSRLWAALALALAGARPGVASAQLEPEPAEEAEIEAAPRLSVIGRFSVARLARWLTADDLDERLRGIERLAEVGTAAALAKLTSHAFERRTQLSGREWLTLARALAPHAADAKGQLVLSMLLNQSPSKAAGPEEGALLELGRGAAALALAAGGGSGALLVLGRALRTVGAPAAAAADALLAHPPQTLAPLLDVPGQPSVELARLLGALGDQRAFHTLRDWVRSEPSDVRAAAAIALTRLGHLETVPLAALWLERGLRELRAAALEILLLAQDARAVPALGALLGDPRPDEAERRLLLDYPSPALAAAVLGALEADASGADFRWTLLGRVGGEAAARRLAAGLSEESSVFVAAHALSRAPGAPAHAVLQQALDASAPSPLALRAAAARAQVRRERFAGLAAQAEAWVASDAPAERATAAWIRALDGGAAARRELESGDDVRILAAANHALAFEPETIDAALRLLAAAPAGARRSALAACLVAPRARRAVSSELLWALVAEGGAARPLALRALASRSDPEIGAGVTSYLDHPDALLREHVARGLGENARASAVGFLVRRLAFETDEGVRRALVMALAAQQGRVVSHWLARAARLDPSPRVRAAARLGLAGVPLADAVGAELLWTELRRTGDAAEEPASMTLLRVAPGLAMPVFADPAGVLVVSGLPSSHLGIRLQ